MELKFFPKSEFDRVISKIQNPSKRLPLIALMCRYNTLSEVKRAGSGHLGSSLSAMDIAVFLYHENLNLGETGLKHPDRDIYFSSKGHDVPGQYAILHSLGIVTEEQLLKLRRLGGLQGHPDVQTPGIEANSGSLGMGISKARGLANAKNLLGHKGRVIVMTGDGEFQEGQNFEALQAGAHQKVSNLIVVVDHNKVQSDRAIDRIVSLRNLVDKFESFGWFVRRCDGHNYDQLRESFELFNTIFDQPKILICDTIKGRGVSFMEHPRALDENGGFYKWHSGAPDDASFVSACQELETHIRREFANIGLGAPAFILPAPEERVATKVSDEFLAVAYGKALTRLAAQHPNLVVLDADLSFDCKLREFEDMYPNRFFESGIAEQDMVSTGAGMALHGLLPICNSFSNFLAARGNEQIYNALTENRRMILACHYAGLIPAGPGKSHQAIRDISLLASLPNLQILQAVNSAEMEMITEHAVASANESVVLRVNIGPSPRRIQLPQNYRFELGKGVALTDGDEDVLLTYGPVMMNEALAAAAILQAHGTSLKVVNMPCLNRFNLGWIQETMSKCVRLFILEDHSPHGGLGDNLLHFLAKENLLRKFQIHIWGVEGFPACGTPAEALQFHKLDSKSLVERVSSARV